jgi:hypothetical protein
MRCALGLHNHAYGRGSQHAACRKQRGPRQRGPRRLALWPHAARPALAVLPCLLLFLPAATAEYLVATVTSADDLLAAWGPNVTAARPQHVVLESHVDLRGWATPPQHVQPWIGMVSDLPYPHDSYTLRVPPRRRSRCVHAPSFCADICGARPIVICCSAQPVQPAIYGLFLQDAPQS